MPTETQNLSSSQRLGGQKLPVLAQRIYGYALLGLEFSDTPSSSSCKTDFVLRLAL
jgi:hypothetical protein